MADRRSKASDNDSEAQTGSGSTTTTDPNEAGSTNVAGVGALSDAGQAALARDPNEAGSDPNAPTTAAAPAGTQLPDGVTAEQLASNDPEALRAMQESVRSAAREELEAARARDEATLARQAAMRPFPSQEEADVARTGSGTPADATLKGE